MTDDAKRKLVPGEFAAAENALRAAEALLGLGLAADAANRIYYAAFHAARALLYSLGLEPTTHRGVQVLIAQHYVAPRLLPPERYKDLIDLEALREAADYQAPVFALGAAHIQPELDRARRFVSEARRLLGH